MEPARKKVKFDVGDKGSGDGEDNNTFDQATPQVSGMKTRSSNRNRNGSYIVKQEATPSSIIKVPLFTQGVTPDEDEGKWKLVFDNADIEKQYLQLMSNKVFYTKCYILREQELKLDPDRPGLANEPTVIALREGPITIDLSDQQLVRLLLVYTKKLKSLQELGIEVDSDTEVSLKEYWLYWSELRASLSRQMPGKSAKEKNSRAEQMMDGIFDKLIVEEGYE